ncbi:MAG: hypothetical protein E7467_08455 [Ruminococcaceae bacterium]|nr:hypothetical protein [Oscillospiraceae bacterium]
MKENMIHCLKVEPGKIPEECTLENSLSALQEAVGGLIELLDILVLVKKLENLFIAPKARQELHETVQRAFARCECAKHTVFLIKHFNQELVLEMDKYKGNA